MRRTDGSLPPSRSTRPGCQFMSVHVDAGESAAAVRRVPAGGGTSRLLAAAASPHINQHQHPGRSPPRASPPESRRARLEGKARPPCRTESRGRGRRSGRGPTASAARSSSSPAPPGPGPGRRRAARLPRSRPAARRPPGREGPAQWRPDGGWHLPGPGPALGASGPSLPPLCLSLSLPHPAPLTRPPRRREPGVPRRRQAGASGRLTPGDAPACAGSPRGRGTGPT